MNIAPGLEDMMHRVADLTELPGNPRRGDVEAVKRSYEQFGQRKPIVVKQDGDRTIVIAGNHQLRAARELGWEFIAVVFANDLTDDEAKGFALADNRIADLGSYDPSLLAEALSDLADRNEALLEAAGWSQQAVDAMTFEFDLTDDLGAFSPIQETPSEGIERYNSLGVIGITFPVAAEAHDELVRRIFALRKRWGMETNSEVFQRLVNDAFDALSD